MQFKNVLAVLALAASAVAQRANIALPLPNSNVAAGSNVTVQVIEGVRAFLSLSSLLRHRHRQLT